MTKAEGWDEQWGIAVTSMTMLLVGRMQTLD